MFLDPADALNQITKQIIGSAIDVHREFGPGLLESAYEACFAYELTQNRIRFQRQVPLPLTYHGVRLDCGYRADFIMEDKVIVEVKSVDAIAKIHHAQMITYLKLCQLPVGLILNFNVTSMRQGIRRIPNNLSSAYGMTS